MTGPDSEPDVRDATPRFDSLTSMQEQHSSLVKEIGGDVLAPGNPDRIAEFIRRGVATGAILDAREDRTAAQSLINFWVSRLSSAASDARRASADGKLSAPPSSAPEIEDTLLGEFDPATIANATEKADRWLETLSDDERRLARGIMLRLVRLSAQGRTFDPVPATRAALEELDPSPQKVGKLIAGLAEAGVVRVTPGNTPETDLVAVRDEVITEWPAFRRWQEERLGFRDQVDRWNLGGRPLDGCLREEALEAARSYNDRNPLEREFTELSRREEILRIRKQDERTQNLRLAVAVLVTGALLLGTLAYQWLLESRRAHSESERAKAQELLAKQESERAKVQELFAKQESERAGEQERLAKDRVLWLREMSIFSGRRTLSRTLGEIALGNASERAIAFERLLTLKTQQADDPPVADFFKNSTEKLAAIQAMDEKTDKNLLLKDLRELQSRALSLSREMRSHLKEISARGAISDEVVESLKRQRSALYRMVDFCASKIVAIASDRRKPYHDANPFLKEFWVLYWGEMGLVEQQKVERAMVDFGDSLRAIDERIVEKIGASQASRGLRGAGIEESFTPRQAIQNSYDTARSLPRSDPKVDDITRVRLEPEKDARDKALVEGLESGLKQLKQALDEEDAGPLF